MRHGPGQWNAREELDRGEQVLVFLFEQAVTYPNSCGYGSGYRQAGPDESGLCR